MPDIAELSEEYSSITLNEINELFHQEIDEFSQDIDEQFKKIKILINKLILDMEMYQNQTKYITGHSIEDIKEKLQKKKDLIYKDFFELQNLINLFIYQKVIGNDSE